MQEAGILPVVGIAVAAVIAIGGLCNVVVKLRQSWKCGVVVDARTSIIQTKKNCDLPPGLSTRLRPNGIEHTLHEPSQVEIEKLITAA